MFPNTQNHNKYAFTFGPLFRTCCDFGCLETKKKKRHYFLAIGGFLSSCFYLLSLASIFSACCQPLCKISRWWRVSNSTIQAMTVDRLLRMLGQVLFTLPACFLVLLVALLGIYETKNTTFHRGHTCSSCTSLISSAYHAPASPGKNVSLQALAENRNSKVATPFV